MPGWDLLVRMDWLGSAPICSSTTRRVPVSFGSPWNRMEVPAPPRSSWKTRSSGERTAWPRMIEGNLYVANILQDTILQITADGAIETLADIDDGLSSPSSLDFGPSQDTDLFFVNSSFAALFFGGDPRPSLMKVVVPEPSSCLLLLTGIAGLAAAVFWHRNSAA